MRRDGTAFTTSQPSPGAFLDAYRDARGHASEVLCVALAAGLSGTFGSAQTAAATSGLDGITVFDSATDHGVRLSHRVSGARPTGIAGA
jgi:fatty acid-binding protein DegV